MITREQALDQLKTILENQAVPKKRDVELAHIAADNILCAVLKKAGYADVVSAYEKIDKWYS